MKVKTLLANLGYLGNVGEGLQKFWGGCSFCAATEIYIFGGETAGKRKRVSRKIG